MDDDNCGKHYLTCCGARGKAYSEDQIEAEAPLITALLWDEVPESVLPLEGSLEGTTAESPNFDQSSPWPSLAHQDQPAPCPSSVTPAKSDLGPRWQLSQPSQPGLRPAGLESSIAPCSEGHSDFGVFPGETAMEFAMLTPNSVRTVRAENVRSSTPRKGRLHSMLEEVQMQTPESVDTEVAACCFGNSPSAQPRYMAVASSSPDSSPCARPRYTAVASGSPGNSPGARPRCSAVACSNSPCNSPRAHPRCTAIASNVRRRL